MTAWQARRLVRWLTSVGLLVLLFLFGGLDALSEVSDRIHWGLLATFLVLNLLLASLFGWRWWALLERRLPLSQAMRVTLIGLGANMVLPARGGDLIRVYQSHALGNIGGHLVLARLFAEKVLDMVAVVLAGGCALALLDQYAVAAVVLVPMMLAALVVMLTVRTGLHERAARVLHRALAAVRLGGLYQNHLTRFLRESRDAFTLSRSGHAIGATWLLWLAVYPALYLTGAAMIDITVDYVDALVLLLAGAVSLAIPAVPSGLGTFHAAVAAGFVLLGHSLAEGVLFATVVHAATTIGFLASAFIAYVLGGFGRLVPHLESRPPR